uniref:C2H2-type domain-containing protein n=1 Tax=Athene cunicularia TaxID=194338 RepID=A0A663N6Q1_ATHCN
MESRGFGVGILSGTARASTPPWAGLEGILHPSRGFLTFFFFFPQPCPIPTCPSSIPGPPGGWEVFWAFEIWNEGSIPGTPGGWGELWAFTKRTPKCSFTGTCAADTQEVACQTPSSFIAKKYMCEYCGKVYPLGRDLKRHQRKHTGERSYKCQDCGKSFRDSWKHLCHQRTHTKEKPFICTMCGKNFSELNIITHNCIHTGESPYSCSLCEMTFQHLSDLRSHQAALHHGESLGGFSVGCPSPGGAGGKIFHGSNSMRRHQRNPPGERPHTCPDGGETCKDFSSLISQCRAQKGERPYK